MNTNNLLEAERNYWDLKEKASDLIQAGKIKQGLSMKPQIEAARRFRDDMMAAIVEPSGGCRFANPVDPMEITALIHSAAHAVTGRCVDVEFVQECDAPNFLGQTHIPSSPGDHYKIRIVTGLPDGFLINTVLHELGHVKAGPEESAAQKWADQWLDAATSRCFKDYGVVTPGLLFYTLSKI